MQPVSEHERHWAFELECGHTQEVVTMIGDFDIGALTLPDDPVVCVWCMEAGESTGTGIQVLRRWISYRQLPLEEWDKPNQED